MGNFTLILIRKFKLLFNGIVYKILGLNSVGLTRIDFGSRLYFLNNITIGNNFVSGNCLRLQPLFKKSKILIGDNVVFNDRVHIASASCVEIGSNCLFASNILITDHGHGLFPKTTPPAKRPLDISPIIIGDNVWIGENVVVYKGVKIGNGSIIGANTFLKDDVPPNTIVRGTNWKKKKINEK